METVAVALVIFRPYPSEGESPWLPTRYDGRRQVPVRTVLGVAVKLARRVLARRVEVA